MSSSSYLLDLQDISSLSSYLRDLQEISSLSSHLRDLYGFSQELSTLSWHLRDLSKYCKSSTCILDIVAFPPSKLLGGLSSKIIASLPSKYIKSSKILAVFLFGLFIFLVINFPS